MDLNRLPESEKSVIRKSPEYKSLMTEYVISRDRKIIAGMAEKKILEQVKSGKP